MRLVTFAEQASPSQVGLIHDRWVADLCAAFERILVEEEQLSAGEAREAAREAIPCTILDLIRCQVDGHL